MNDKKWHKLVCEKANYVCSKCNKDFSYPMYFNEKGVNQYVCGHHIKHKRNYPELRHEVSNGACICMPCHLEEHS